MIRVLSLILVLLLAAPVPAAVAGTDGGPSQEQLRQDEQTPYILVLDTSGSMNDMTDVTSARDQRRTRIDLAKSGVQQIITGLGDTNSLGIISYPGNGVLDAQGCSRGEIIAELSKETDTNSISATVRKLSAGGNTPTGPALLHAVDKLKEGGHPHGVIMLFSDGEANCGSQTVCELAQEIVDEGFHVTVNTALLAGSDKAKEDLACVARVTGGVAVHTEDPAELENMIRDSILPELHVDAGNFPSATSRIAGPDSAGTAAPVAVRVTGNGTARNVSASLTFFTDDDVPGAIPIRHPVQYFGNLTADEPAVLRSFYLRPGSEQTVPAGKYRWELTVTGENVNPRRLEGEIEVTDELAFGEIFRDVEHAVVMGDSYASGEGAESSLDGYQGADTFQKACHRSSNNYGTRLFGEDKTTTLACSGATAPDLYFKNEKKAVPAQFDRLEELVREERADAVLMSIGGNDIGFGSIIERCLLHSFCGLVTAENMGYSMYDAVTEMQQMGGSAKNRIHSALAVADETLNADGGDRPVVAVPYPRVITSTNRLPADRQSGVCFPGIVTDEVKLLNGLIDALNQSMRDAVEALRAEGRPVYYASGVIESFQPHHTICDSDSWVVGYAAGTSVISPIAEALAAGGRDKLVHWAQEWDRYLSEVGRYQQQLVHPNADGHAAMARAIAAWSTTDEAMKPAAVAHTANTGTTPFERDTPNEFSRKRTFGIKTIEAMVSPALPAVGAVQSGLDSVKETGGKVWESTKSIGEDVLVASGELLSQVDWEIFGDAALNALTTSTGPTMYRITLNSHPAIVEYGVVGESGELPTHITVPASVPAGEHTLVLHLMSDDGTTQRFEAPVTVVSQGAVMATAGMVGGLVLLLIGLLGLLVFRRR